MTLCLFVYDGDKIHIKTNSYFLSLSKGKCIKVHKDIIEFTDAWIE
jgi:hypothetical protein